MTRRWRFISNIRTRLSGELARPSNLIALSALLVAVYVLLQNQKPRNDAEAVNAAWQAKFDQQAATSDAAFSQQQQKLELMMAQSDLQLKTERVQRLGVGDTMAQSELVASLGRYETLLGQTGSPSLYDEVILANALVALGDRERALEMLVSITDRYGAANQWREASHTALTAMALGSGVDGEFEPAAEQARKITGRLHPVAARQYQVQRMAYTVLHHARNDRFDHAGQLLVEWQGVATPSHASTYRMIEADLTDAQREALKVQLAGVRKQVFP